MVKVSNLPYIKLCAAKTRNGLVIRVYLTAGLANEVDRPASSVVETNGSVGKLMENKVSGDVSNVEN